MIVLDKLKEQKTEYETRTLITAFLCVFFFLNLIIISLFETVTITGISMYPTCEDKDMGICMKIGKINRFDVVNIESSKIGKTITKRIIGMPGDIIEYRDNVLYINGIKNVEPYLHEGCVTEDFKVTVSEDCYFVLGDNREKSYDSRHIGEIPKTEIIGKFILFIN